MAEIRKINAIAQARLIRCLLDAPMNCTELAEETGLHYVTVLAYCRELHRAGAAHIAAWEPDRRGRHITKVYRLGHARDARRPKMTVAERQAKTRARRAAAASPLLQLAAGGAV